MLRRDTTEATNRVWGRRLVASGSVGAGRRVPRARDWDGYRTVTVCSDSTSERESETSTRTV